MINSLTCNQLLGHMKQWLYILATEAEEDSYSIQYNVYEFEYPGSPNLVMDPRFGVSVHWRWEASMTTYSVAAAPRTVGVDF
jgi:hypothetical protein